MAHPIVLVASAVCLLIAYHFIQVQQRLRRARAHGCQPLRRYRHYDPFLGLDIFFTTGKAIVQSNLLPELWSRYQTYGHTFETIRFGITSVNSVHPENLKTVWISKYSDWGTQPIRLSSMEAFCGKGFITMDGAAWEHSRALLKPTFKRSNISDFTHLEECLRLVINQIPTNGTAVDLQQLFCKMYLDTSTQFLFGESIGVLSGNAPAHAEGFLEAFEAGFFGSGMRIALGPFKFLLPSASWLKACRKSHEFVEFYVKKGFEYRDAQRLRQKQNQKEELTEADIKMRKTLLYHTIEQVEDREYIRNQLIQALMAAQETTSVLLSNVFWFLARHPKVWERLRAEVLAIGDNTLDFDQLGQLKYLQNILNECLRLYPVFPQMTRIALRDTTLPVGGGPDMTGPVFVPKGTMFDTSWSTLHRLRSIWGEDADEFRPERWEVKGFRPNTCEYMPFGVGTHMCAGQQKAQMEVSYLVVRMLQTFKAIEPRDDQPWKGQVQLTVKNLHGCVVALERA